MTNTEDVCRAIDFLIDYLRSYDIAVAEQVNLFFSPIKRGDISEALTVLRGRLCQVADNQTTSKGSDNEEPDNHAGNEEVGEEPEQEPNSYEPHEETNMDTNTKSSVQSNVEEEPDDEESNVEDEESNAEAEPEDEEASIQSNVDEEPNTEETDLAKSIYKSFSDDFEERARRFIFTYNDDRHSHFWNRLPQLNDGEVIPQLIKALDGRDALGQRLLERKLFEQVEIFETQLSSTVLKRGESIKGVALQCALGHQATRSELFRVDRGEKFSIFEFIDLFRISVPHWTMWVKSSEPPLLPTDNL